MQYRLLGRTGLEVSALALGTVALGIEYGIAMPGEFGRPSEAEAMALLRQAREAGINLFDTAPTYGASERVVGLALGRDGDCVVATKVPIPTRADGRLLQGAALQAAVRSSLENSLRALQRDVLDIVQIHNATVDVITRGEMTEILLRARQQGWVRFLGASVYEEGAALAAIDAGCFDVLQVAYNVLDQRMATRVFPAARHAEVGLIVRSAFLKGVLTTKVQWLPDVLAPLREAARHARDALTGSWERLPQMALRFCLAAPEIAAALVGVRTVAELEQALAGVQAGPLPANLLARTSTLALADDTLLNPSLWPVT